MDRYKDSYPASSSPPIAMMGVPFDNVSTSDTIDLIRRMVTSRRPHYLATANVDFLVQASQDVELRRILFDAHLVLCDGTPLVWASRLLGNPLPERVAGSDLVPLLLKVAEEEGYRPFFSRFHTRSTRSCCCPSSPTASPARHRRLVLSPFLQPDGDGP